MSLFQYLVFTLALTTAIPFVCRLGLLHPSEHLPTIWLMHIAMAIAIVFGGYSGWCGVAQLGDFCAVAGPLLWIWISYPSWSRGVPSHFIRPGRSVDADVVEFR